MKLLFTIFSALSIYSCATASAQTIKSLGYNSTNGQIVAATNVSFTNSVSFGEIKADTLIMPKIGAPQILANITNGNLSASGVLSGGTVTTSSGGSIVVVSSGSLRFDAGATISNSPTVNFANTINAAQTRTNLGLGATWLTNTNLTNFRTAIGLGANWLTNTNLTNFRDAINLGYSNNQFAQIKIFKNTNGIFTPPLDPDFGIFFLDVFSWVPQLRFVYSGSHYSVAFTNSLPSWALTTDNSVARTELGLPLAALTNTNVTNFRTAIGLGATNSPSFSSVLADTVQIPASGGWTISGVYLPNSISFMRSGIPLAVLKTNGELEVHSIELQAGPVSFSTTNAASTTRTNLGIGATWLTNTNVTNFRSAIGLGWSALTNTNAATSLLGYTGNGQVVANTGTNLLTFTNAVVNLPNVSFNGVYSETVFGGTVLFEGPFVNANEFRGTLQIMEGQQLYFENASDASITRTNLGLPLAVLTNTNNANFISALGVLATNGNAAGLTNFPTVATASNVTGVVALTNGGSGASNAQTARSNFFGHGGISTNISVVGTNNTNVLVFTNGLLKEVQ